MSKSEYAVYILPRTSESDPERTIELDTDDTMWFTIEFERCKDVIWKAIVRQADDRFAFVSESDFTDGSGCIERTYENAANMSVMLCADYASDTISVTARMPQSAKAIDMFTDTVPIFSGCCVSLSNIIRAALADKDLEDMFDEFRC